MMRTESLQKKEGTKSEEDLTVGLHDIALGREIYSPSIPRYTVIGALIGALLCGIAAWLIAIGEWRIEYVGQFSASGEWWATFTGSGAGAAVGGLAGGTFALLRMHRRNLQGR